MCCAYSPQGGSTALRRSAANWSSIPPALACWAMTTTASTASFVYGTSISSAAADDVMAYPGSASELPDIESQAVLDIARPVESAIHQSLYALLRLRPGQ